MVVALLAACTGVSGAQARVGQPRERANFSEGGLATVTFTYTGGEQSYTVPDGVTSLEVEAVGANGANSRGPDPVLGGSGGMVIGELADGADAAVRSGETLYVAVGETFRGDRLGGGGAAGGFFPGNGSAGGGAADVRTCSRTATSCPNGDASALTRLIVAAGGGGAGGCFEQSNCEFFAGRGGSAGEPGDGLPGTGGGAGTLAAPDAGGLGALASGTSGGVDGTGGTGATQPNGGLGKLGSGGGGGYTGGGGGIGIASNGRYVAAGGGGGANYASPLASNGTFGLGGGKQRLVITPRPASSLGISRIDYNLPGPDTASNTSLDAEWIRLRNTGRTVLQLRGWRITDAEGHVYRFERLALQPGHSVTTHSGRGRDTAGNQYWDRHGYSWANSHDLVRLYRPNGTLADQCRYDDAKASQIRC